jgi:mRNA deadenylase 3'-5' endonuclease subunit Ccr4
MSWQYRKRNLVRELLSHRADIICLQVRAADKAPSSM